jgi:hypothetical protein
MFGVAVGVGAIVAALGFGTSLDHQLDDPARFQIDGREAAVLAIDRVRGEVRPPLLEGRYPATAAEVAVGTRTRSRLDLDIGDEIDLTSSRGDVSYTIVGDVLVPTLNGDGRLDEGALLTLDGAARVETEAGDSDIVDLVLGLREGSSAQDVIDAVAGSIGGFVISLPLGPPTDIANAGEVRAMPSWFAAVAGVLAAATLVHTAIVSARRRRLEAWSLRAIGFTRRQIRVSAGAHAAVLASAAVVIGLPLGIVGGRMGWRALASSLGSPLEPRLPAAWLFVVVPLACLLLAALAGALLSRPATRIESRQGDL